MGEVMGPPWITMMVAVVPSGLVVAVVWTATVVWVETPESREDVVVVGTRRKDVVVISPSGVDVVVVGPGGGNVVVVGTRGGDVVVVDPTRLYVVVVGRPPLTQQDLVSSSRGTW